jgi:hypothetical protein
MPATIDFHDKLAFDADKIRDLSTNRVLASKFVTAEASVFDFPPK